jgi:hypothetical protein
MQHSHAEIPEQQPAIFAHGSKSIVAIIAAPWIKAHSCYPRLVALAARNNDGFGDRPDGNEIILTTCENVLAIG